MGMDVWEKRLIQRALKMIMICEVLPKASRLWRPSSMQDTLEKALGMDGKSLADIGEQHLGKNSVQEK